MRMLTCKQAEKMVMPYIDGRLDEEELEDFLSHVNECPACREELEIYFTVYVGLRQLAVRLRKVVCYAVNTLVTVSILVMLAMQLRIWIG